MTTKPTLDDLLDGAIAREQRTLANYSAAMRSTRDQKRLRVLEELAESERAHRARLEGLRRHPAFRGTIPLDGPDLLAAAKVLLGDEDAAHRESDADDAILDALKRLHSSRTLFGRLAESARDAELKEALRGVADADDEHFRAIRARVAAARSRASRRD